MQNKALKIGIISFIIFFVIVLILFTNKQVVSSDCIAIKEDGEISIVFLSYGYKDQNNFFSDVNDYVYGENGFLAIEPFKENKDKLSFYAIATDDVVCNIEDKTFICDDRSTKKIASKCPHNYIFVLADRNKFLDFVEPIRSSAYLNLASINTADNKLVVLHEFGHLFGGLADEYVEKGIEISPEEFPNCDYQECNKWNNFSNTGCFKGCSKTNYYRSIETGIMRNYLKSNTFGEWNKWILKDIL